MRREEYFLGDLESGGALNESDFRRGLELVIEPGVLPESQRYDALQALVHWGLEGARPDLAMGAYDAYIVHGWTWQTKINDEMRREAEQADADYFNERHKKEEETDRSHDGMPYFSKFDVEHLGAIEGRVSNSEKEGEAFRNEVLPRIIAGLLADGQVQQVYDFLTERRTIHGFRGYPREIEAEQCVNVHVWTAQVLLDPANESAFEGDKEEAFRDLATFGLEHSGFPQFGNFQIVPRLAPIRQDMIDRGLADPWEVFASGLDNAVRRFNDGMFGVDALFNGIRHYLTAAKAGEVEDLRTLRQWPEHALEAFDMVERNPSIPSGLAWLIPAARSGNLRVSASDAFQSSPTLGKDVLLAAMGDEDAQIKVEGLAENGNTLESGTISLQDALNKVTNTRPGQNF